MVEALKRAEENARAQQLGFWKDPAYAIKTPDSVKDFLNSYQIVEGKILSVNQKGTGVVFFNFGKNWKTDFSVRIKKDFQVLAFIKDPDAPPPKKPVKYTYSVKNSDPLQWKNRIVRVRGWVTQDKDGPLIDLTHKEQIDFVPQNKK